MDNLKGSRERLPEIITTIKPLIEQYFHQKAEVIQRLIHQGTIDPVFCENCHQNDKHVEVKKLSTLQSTVSEFVDWIASNKITKISSTTEDDKLEILARKSPLLDRKGIPFTENEWVFSLKKSVTLHRITNPTVREFLELDFNELDLCPHIADNEELHEAKPIIIRKKSKNRVIELQIRTPSRLEQILDLDSQFVNYSSTLHLVCESCWDILGHNGCLTGIEYKGRSYHYTCGVNQLVFENVFHRFLPPQRSRDRQGDGSHSYYSRDWYLPKLNVFISDHSYRYDYETVFISERSPLSENETLMSISPQLLVIFGQKKDLLKYISLKFEILFIVDEQKEGSERYLLFDRNRPIQSDEEKIIAAIQSNLRPYVRNLPGKDHDRLISAIVRIGQELGYVSEKEFQSREARVDVAWLDRHGKVRVAIEIETATNWKKDLITTWELEPHLAIILIHAKTRRNLQSLLQYQPMKVLPHRLLFINNTLGELYLVDKQELVRQYTIHEEKSVLDGDFLEI